MRLFKPFCCAIGLRYCFSRLRPGFVSLTSMSSVVGMALGVAILIIVLSVFNGFSAEMRHHLAGVERHITFTPWQPEQWHDAMQWLDKQQAVLHVQPFVEVQSLIKQGEQAVPVLLKGQPLQEAIPFSVRLDATLAHRLQVHAGQSIWLVSAHMHTGPMGTMPSFRRFNVAVVDASEHHGIQAHGSVISDLDSARRLAGLSDDGITGLSVVIDAPEAASFWVDQWRSGLQSMGWLHAWSDDYQAFFQSIVLQKTMMFLVLMLIVLMAVFSLVSGLVMLVTHKQAEVAILKTMGWSPLQVWSLFMTHGVILVVLSMLMGSLLGIYISHRVTIIVQTLEAWMGEPWLSHALYGMQHMPSELLYSDVIWVNGTAFALSVLAISYPALQATRVEPVAVLKAGGGQ